MKTPLPPAHLRLPLLKDKMGLRTGFGIRGALSIENLRKIDIIDEKLWIQQDGTEEGIAEEMVKMSIPKDKIILAYKSLERRTITEFAVF